MTTPITLASKAPDERYSYTWTPSKSGDTITGNPTIEPVGGTATLDGAPTKIDDNRAAKFWLIGGANGETTELRASAVMASGDRIEQTIFIGIVNSSSRLLDLPAAKRHLRVDHAADDGLIEDAMAAARGWVEDYTGLVLARREVTETLPSFLNQTRLRAWPVAADQPVSIEYRDSAGVIQTITGSVLRAASRPGVIYPAPTTFWPNARTISGPIEVTFTAGYADPADVPAVLKQAMLIMLTAFYEDREGGDMFKAAEQSAMALSRRYKRRTL